jgi:hypothetical protein
MGNWVNILFSVAALGVLIGCEIAGIELSEYLMVTLGAVVGWTVKSPGALADKAKGK